MKKILALILCMAMLAVLAIPAAAADVTLSAPKATIKIDGVKDDAYGEPVDIASFGPDNITGATGKIWAAWDDSNIYYYLEVKDTTPNHDHESNWARDCVEFFADWKNHKGDTNANDDSPFWQIRIASAPNEDGSQFSNGINGQWDVQEYLDMSSANTVVKPLVGNDLKGGYIIETTLSAKLVEGGMTLAEGTNITIDFQVGDNQTGDGRTSSAFLTNDDFNEQWNKPSGCHGILSLAPAKAAAAPVVEAPAAVEELIPALEVAPAPVAATTTVAAPASAPATGDSVIIFLAIALIGACIVSKNVIKNRA